MPRKTDSNNPADWLWIAAADLDVVILAMSREISFITCRSKLAEILEKILKAELIRLGWPLEKTHDLNKISELLNQYSSPLVDLAVPVCKSLADAYFTDRYPGFDMDDPDWPTLQASQIQVAALMECVKNLLSGK